MTVFHEGDGDESGFTCCAFSARERFLILGTCSGHLKFYNIFSGEEVVNYTCHTSAITHLEPSRVGSHTHTHTHTRPSSVLHETCFARLHLCLSVKF